MDLTQYGLSSKEAQFYLELLTHGPQTVKMLAAATGEQRTNCYLIVRSLIDHNLVFANESKPVTSFEAKHPQNLKQSLLGERRQLDNAAQELTKVLPELTSLYRLSTETAAQRISYFKGINGYKAVLDDMNQAKEILSFISETIFTYQPRVYSILEEQFRQRDAKHIRSRFLACQATKPVVHTVHFSSAMVETRVVETELFDGEVTIYGNKIALTTYDRKQLTTLVLSDEHQAKTFHSIFEVLWSFSQ